MGRTGIELRGYLLATRGRRSDGRLPVVDPQLLVANGLPFNRKERFFTATILPVLACGEDLSRLDRLLGHLNVPYDPPMWTRAAANTQLVTEYGIAESVPFADPRFAVGIEARDTPDVVIYQPQQFLLGIEAKMFDRPSVVALNEQVQRQRDILLPLAGALGLDDNQVHQVILLPKHLSGVKQPVLTWAELLSLYDDGPTWAVDVLRHALNHWDSLVGTSQGAGAHELITGTDIVTRYQSGDVMTAVVGRNKGLDGKAFVADVESGGWQDWPYQVRYEADPPNSNWFPVADFVERVSAAPSASLIELSSWLITRDAYRLYGDDIVARELHPGGGQSDVLCLSRTSDLGVPHTPMLWLNREGTIQTVSPDAMLSSWAQAVTTTGRERVLTSLTKAVAIPRIPAIKSVAATTVDCLATLLELSQRGLAPSVHIRSAVLDTSGYGSDGGWKTELLRPFPIAASLLGRSARPYASEDWQWWLLLDSRNGTPLALINLTGQVWRPGEPNASVDLSRQGPDHLLRILLEAAQVSGGESALE